MRYVVFAMLLCVSTIGRSASASPDGKVVWRVAQAANACLVNCASERDSCKRLCPANDSEPSSAGDNQAQFCQQK